MASLEINGTSVAGNALQQVLTCNDLLPGDDASYQTCKTIYTYHPLGAKMVDVPIQLAQSQPRDITIPKGPEETLKEAYWREWKQIKADEIIANVARIARIYGIGSLALVEEDGKPEQPINLDSLADAKIGFNVLDPLNTAGSLVLDQNPNNVDYQKIVGISVAGQPYHRSRTVTIMNEKPLYIEYTTSAFGYVGRSVYQRPLFPLKSFVQSMMTDDLVSLKAGVIVAKMKGPGSIIDRAMQTGAAIKRGLLKEAQNGNVISIDVEEALESLNLQNIDTAAIAARKNILDNIATGGGMPAKLLNSETFAEGFGEGTEDAKAIAKFIANIREWLNPLYEFFDTIVQHRAWNEEFYETVKKQFKEYRKVSYKNAFYSWTNSFEASWPNLLEEPDSEKIQVDDVKLKAAIAAYEVMVPNMDAANKVLMAKWLADTFNELKRLFPNNLDLDFEALQQYSEEQAEQQRQQADAAAEGGGASNAAGSKEPTAPKPFAAQDSQPTKAMKAYADAVADLQNHRRERRRRAA